MTTSLFPKKEPIFIRQGKTSNCYLMAALDCILRDPVLGRDFQSRFIMEKEGGVWVRFPHTHLSKNLKLHAKKMKFHYEQREEEDWFFFSPERVAEIDNPSDEEIFNKSVKTNSLAVKIIERLVAYYLYCDWVDHSITGHDQLNRFAKKQNGTHFIAALLGLKLQKEICFNDMIRFKTLFPFEPIYISIAWGERGRRHALRLHEIRESYDIPGEYYFILANPSNNQKLMEMVMTEEIFYGKKARCDLFHPADLYHYYEKLWHQYPMKRAKITELYKEALSIDKDFQFACERKTRENNIKNLELGKKFFILHKKYEEMKKNKELETQGVRIALAILLNIYRSARYEYIEGNISLAEFNRRCLIAIEQARPVLETQRGTRKIFLDLMNTVLRRMQWKEFHPKPSSSKCVKRFKKFFDKSPVSDIDVFEPEMVFSKK